MNAPRRTEDRSDSGSTSVGEHTALEATQAARNRLSVIRADGQGQGTSSLVAPAQLYESRFGFSASPFKLVPDPGFYYGSRGHEQASAYLKYGVHQAEGFVVLTGEVGSGKTMLVRRLMHDLQTPGIVVGEIANTQLGAVDLLQSAAIAFGIPPAGLSKARLLATLEAFLIGQSTLGRRALLIIDEAHNLHPHAIEELRMLSNHQLGDRALLQSFLIGQPQLRTLMRSRAMEPFMQRVVASCHLGAMDAAETAAYVEHRLRTANWQGRPQIDADAFEAVFRASGGIPRRINTLCHRLLLSACLSGCDRLGADLVHAVTAEIAAESGPA